MIMAIWSFGPMILSSVSQKEGQKGIPISSLPPMVSAFLFRYYYVKWALPNWPRIDIQEGDTQGHADY